MKRLERISMVHFFLYEKVDLDIGLNTAFLGPNGTGKSALLDALQLVMLAADRNRMHFNAAGEGKKHSRSLRDYCLGAHVPGGSEFKRTSSNTYVDLSFVDEATGIPFSAGVSLTASIDSQQAELNGLYLLPGVGLDTNIHVEREGSKDVVLPYRQFMHKASDLCREAGTTALFTQNREEFTRKLLIDHLSGPGDTPNVRTFRAAFPRSLKLGEEITDLNDTLRVHLIEAQPTGVKEFRARLDDVRKLRDLVRSLRIRIDRATDTVDKYQAVKAHRTNEANLEALKSVYNAERLGETIAETDDAVSELQVALDVAERDVLRAESDLTQSNEERDRALAALHQNPDFARQIDENQSLAQAESTLRDSSAALTKSLAGLSEVIASTGKLPELTAHQQSFEDALLKVESLSRLRESGAVPLPGDIQSCADAVSSVHAFTRRALTRSEESHRDALARLRDAKTALERAGRGAPDLRPQTLGLLNVLAEAGIQATPICDLVRIADPDWQPILEAYLGPHIEALLVPAADEVKAIDLYRGLRGSRAVYGVKLALPSRLRSWQAPSSGTFAAQLIEGQDKDAVRYLQGELGITELVHSSEQLRVGRKALSKEGMISTGGGIERRRPQMPDELRLGRADNVARASRAHEEYHRAEITERDARVSVQRLTAAERRLSPFSDPASLQPSLDEAFLRIRREQSLVADLRSALLATQTDLLDAAQKRKASADVASSEAMERVKSLTRHVATLREKIASTRTIREALGLQLESARSSERKCRSHVLYDANEVDRHRQRLDERHGGQWDEKMVAVDRAIQNARSTAANADRDAWTLCSTYLSDFHLTNNDLSSADWMGVLAFMLKERQRLVDLELADQEARAEEAYQAAVRVFRTDVAQAILEGFDRIDEQIQSLNTVLSKAPEFSNGERYVFRRKVVPLHQPLYDFLLRVRDVGSAEDDMFGAGTVPEAFRDLVEGDPASELLLETSPLQDHRRFFTYDIEVFQDKTSIGFLSRRFGPASGGEHRTPVYLIFGAALASAYGKAKGGASGGGLMLLDEAFEKMDPQNVRAAVTFLNGLGLQLIMAGPESDQSKLSSFLHVYYDMSRAGSKTVRFNKNIVTQQARDLLQTDNYFTHPDLLEQEISRLEALRAAG
jgi:chromosome segregation protein